MITLLLLECITDDDNDMITGLKNRGVFMWRLSFPWLGQDKIRDKRVTTPDMPYSQGNTSNAMLKYIISTLPANDVNIKAA